MSYLHPGMPPVIRYTSANADGSLNWQLESQDGAVIETYTTDGVRHPDDWWDDMALALLDTQSRAEALWDMLRYNARRDHEIVDEL